MLNVLSFDVANKSLAVAYIRFNTQKYEQIEQALCAFRELKTTAIATGLTQHDLLCAFAGMLDTVTAIYDNVIDIKHVDVKDLIPNKKISETSLIFRTAALRNYLVGLDAVVMPFVGPGEELKILVEYQMGPNEKSRTVSSQLLYHYTEVLSNMAREPDGNIILVGPSLKNTIYIGGDDAAHNNFLDKYKTNYAANKAHSRFNLVRLLQMLNKTNVLAGIAKKNYDDLGDAVMMAVAWVVTNYEI